MYANLFKALHEMIGNFTSKLTGVNVVTQSWGNNSIPPFEVKVGSEVVLRTLTTSMPARKDIVKSLKTGNFACDKSASSAYNKLLDSGKLPSIEALYLMGYMAISILRGNAMSRIGVVRVAMVNKMLNDLPKSVKFSLLFEVEGKGEDKIKVELSRANITSIFNGLSPIGNAYDNIEASSKSQSAKIKLEDDSSLFDLSAVK